jgi:ribonuclease P protein subunit RPR2
MAKQKVPKGVPNKHLHTRIAYLHKIANYLSTQSLAKPDEPPQQATSTDTCNNTTTGEEQPKTNPPGTLATDATTSLANLKPSPGHSSTATFNPPASGGLPLQLTAHLRSVAQKGQIRLSRDLKHSFCKICSSPLIEGETCIRSTENLSRKGRKPWAEVAIVTCCACGACKRFPVGAKRQKRKALRGVGEKEGGGVSDGAVHEGPKGEREGMEGVVQESTATKTNGSSVLPARESRALMDTSDNAE